MNLAGRPITRMAAIALVALASRVLCACASDQNDILTRQGFITVTPQISGIFTLADGTAVTLPDSMTPDPAYMQVTLTDAEGASATWPTVTAFNAKKQSFMSGGYNLRISHDGTGGGPSFEGSASLTLAGGQTVDTHVQVRPSMGMLITKANCNSSTSTLDSLVVLNPGLAYTGIKATGDVTFVNPGTARVFAALQNNGRHIMLDMGFEADIAAARAYRMTADLDGDRITTDIDGRKQSQTLNPQLFDGTPPHLTARGFEPGTPLQATEGLSLANPVTITASSSTAIKHLYLSVQSPLSQFAGTDITDIDLLNPDPQMIAPVDRYGLQPVASHDGKTVTVDFTAVIERMSTTVSATSVYTLVASDQTGLCSQPMRLCVLTKVMQLAVLDMTPAVIGRDITDITLSTTLGDVEQSDFSVFATDASGQYTQTAPISGFWQTDTQVTLQVRVPPGTGPVPLVIKYLDVPRLQFAVPRANPVYTVDANEFATRVDLKILPDPALYDDTQAVAAAMSRYARVKINGTDAAVTVRDPGNGTLTVTGLQPAKNYTLQIEAAEGAAISAFDVTTEKAQQIPDADFADRHTVTDFKHLPCGGRYATTNAGIINRQNFADVRIDWPKKHWATTNAMTFNTKATNKNTWYMQPTATVINVIEGTGGGGYWGDVSTATKAIEMASVGWDPAGAPIPDYIPRTPEGPPYSLEVPPVAHCTAGRFWLGGFAYDAATGAMRFDEGISFTSRPTAINGYYKYLPAASDTGDTGFMWLELLNIDSRGQETLVASASAVLGTSADYRAFSVNLQYRRDSIKPNRLRLMFITTQHAARYPDAAGNDPGIALDTDLPGACMRGSRLSISSLNFTY